MAIARALAQAPAVILADEPTASLDPALTSSIMDILRRINVERGLTLVVSQHQLETALAYATRVVGLPSRPRRASTAPPAAVTPAVAATIYGDGSAMRRARALRRRCWCWRGARGTPAPIPSGSARGIPWILDFLRRMLPPDLSVLPAALLGALKTVEIALLGTAVAAVLALPLGFLSARNVAAPGGLLSRARVLNFFRSVDTLVYALSSSPPSGSGRFPACSPSSPTRRRRWPSSTPRRSRASSRGPVDAITATGATRLQVLRYGVLPQVLPLFLSYVLYRLETNIRAATVLGFVGAGGIGFYLQTYLRMIDYPAASTVLLVTVVMVMVVDPVSSRLRARLV